MKLLHGLRSLARNLFGRARVERDLEDEMRSCLGQLTDEKIRAGLPAREARRAAAMEFGGVEQVKEEIRDARRGRLLEQFCQDVRFALRTLAKNPGFTSIAVLALSLGIGANGAMFSVVYGILLRPLPYPDADRVAMVYMNWHGRNNPRANLSIADYLDWKAQNHAFEDPSLYGGTSRFDVTGLSETEQIHGTEAAPGVFAALRARPLLGRVFLPGEERPGAPKLAVIGEAFRRRRFGGSGVLGKTIVLNGVPRTIVGVMPEEFHFPHPDAEVWTNLEIAPPTRHGPYFYHGIGRLRPGVSLDAAQRETDAIGRQIERANPRLYSDLHLPIELLRDSMVGSVRTALLVMAGAVGLVLLIAVVNVANLLLARATVREREMALRLSLGANRGRLIRQLLTESVLLASFGGASGLGVAYGLVALLRRVNPGFLPRVEDVRVDGTSLVFLCAAAIAAGVLFGLAPALQSARTNLNAALQDGGRSGSAGNARRRMRAGLVVAEIALSMMLLVGAGLLLRSLARLQEMDLGFHAPPREILSLSLSPAARQYADEKIGLAMYARLLERARRVPGIQLAAISDGLPPDQEADADTFTLEGETVEREARNPVVSVGTVSPDYFRALGVPLRKGRYFTEHDTATSAPVTIISDSMARRFFPGVDPIGRRLKRSGPSLTNVPFMEIVGVVGDVTYAGLPSGADSATAYYAPFTQNYSRRAFLVVRGSRNVAGTGPALRREVMAEDPDIVITSIRTMAEDVRSSMARPRFDAWLLGTFAGVALLMAAIGIYGVIAYSVAQRTHEIGVRLALGAGRTTVIGMVIRQAAALAAAGIGIGLAGAFGLTRLLDSLLFGTSATDGATFATVAAGLFCVALAAAFVPARRATRISPVVALRG